MILGDRHVFNIYVEGKEKNKNGEKICEYLDGSTHAPPEGLMLFSQKIL